MAEASRPPGRLARRVPARAIALAGALLLLGVAAVLLRLLPGFGLDGTRGVPRVVYAEFGPTGDHLYTAPATDPAKRTLVDTIEHADGWGINPGVMSGNLVAYAVLPTGTAGGRGAPAELWILDVATKQRTRLARDADLTVRPQLTDANTILYRTTTGDRQAIVRVDIAKQSRTVVYEEQTAFGVFPVGFDAGGALIFVRLSTAGTDVLSARPGAQATPLFHASNELARDWQLSPDRQAIAFLAPETRAERVVYRAQVVQLSGAHPAVLPEVAAAGEQYGPTWTSDGRSLTVGQEAGTAGAAPVTLLRPGAPPTSLASPPRGFDVPFAWSAQDQYLAAHTFDGANSTNPGRESAVVIAQDGARRAIPATGEVILVGWLPRA